MKRLHCRIAKLEQHQTNDQFCPVCRGTGVPGLGVDVPPRPTHYAEWLKATRWAQQFWDEHKRPEK